MFFVMTVSAKILQIVLTVSDHRVAFIFCCEFDDVVNLAPRLNLAPPRAFLTKAVCSSNAFSFWLVASARLGILPGTLP